MLTISLRIGNKINFRKNVINTFSYKLIQKYFTKFYKVSFTGLDKYLSNEELKAILSEFNEINIHRTSKSTNKNYGHADISTHLESDKIKSKFEGIKIMGKTVKIRLKEIDEEIQEIMSKQYNNFDYSEIRHNNQESSKYLQDYIKGYCLKNMHNNPFEVKKLITELESRKNNDWMIVENYNSVYFQFEYAIQTIKGQKFKNIKDFKNFQTFLPIKSLTEFFNDSKNSEHVEMIKLMSEKIEKIFANLNYNSYDTTKKKGVYRNLNIKLFNNSYLVSLMISMAELSNIDVKLIIESLKFEFNSLKNVVVYLTINEKVQGVVDNSSIFYFVTGSNVELEDKNSEKLICLPVISTCGGDKYKNSGEEKENNHESNDSIGITDNKIRNYNSKIKIKIYPFINEFPIHLKKLDLRNIFGKNKFNNVIDFSSRYVLTSSILDFESSMDNLAESESENKNKDRNFSNSGQSTSVKKILTLKQEFNFSVFDVNSKTEMKVDDLINPEVVEGENKIQVTKFENMNLLEKFLSSSNFTSNDLLIYNTNMNISGIDRLFLLTKYHLIFSPSINQILDFIKIYGNNNLNCKLLKVVVIKDELYGVRETVFAFENQTINTNSLTKP